MKHYKHEEMQHLDAKGDDCQNDLKHEGHEQLTNSVGHTRPGWCTLEGPTEVTQIALVVTANDTHASSMHCMLVVVRRPCESGTQSLSRESDKAKDN